MSGPGLLKTVAHTERGRNAARLAAHAIVHRNDVEVGQAIVGLDIGVDFHPKLTPYPIQCRSEVEIAGSSEIAVAGCCLQRRANSADVTQSSAECGRLSV